MTHTATSRRALPLILGVLLAVSGIGAAQAAVPASSRHHATAQPHKAKAKASNKHKAEAAPHSKKPKGKKHKSKAGKTRKSV